MKFFLIFVTVLASFQMATANAYQSRSNGINWDKNGNAVCTYGQIKSCQTAAFQGDRGAKQYVDQRIANNPNPNKTTFYNYSPPAKAPVVSQTKPTAKAVTPSIKVVSPTKPSTKLVPPSCSAQMKKLYGSDCR